MSLSIFLAERGLLPDSLIRFGIRRLDAQRLRMEHRRAQEPEYFNNFIADLRRSKLALEVEKANEQHYELPPEFFKKVLGRHLKYSSCFFPKGDEPLDAGEAEALKLTCEHAQLENGMNILELGCGWGSLSLWMAEHYPQACIVGVSNSRSQREYIEGQCRARGLTNLKIVNCDVNFFDPFAPNHAPDIAERKFDRVVSVEMFEHLRNFELLFERIGSWLNARGKLFCHVFCHRKYPYLFEKVSDNDWMGKYFFTAGLMPSENLLPQFQRSLKLEEQWWWNGRHYGRTAELWLQNQDAHDEAILPLMRNVYGSENARLWHLRWRIFFMACAELFNYSGGEEWGVAHYRFAKGERA